MFEPRLNHYIILAESMADGIAPSNIANKIGISVQTLKKYFNESLEGYTFKRKKKITKPPYIKGTNVGKNLDTSRDSDMIERYRKGETLKQIGDSYGITRERVRQILINIKVVRK